MSHLLELSPRPLLPQNLIFDQKLNLIALARQKKIETFFQHTLIYKSIFFC